MSVHPGKPTDAEQDAAAEAFYDAKEFDRIEHEAERLVTIREAFEYGFKAGLSKAGLTSSADDSYELWIWSRERLASSALVERTPEKRSSE